MLIVIDVGNTNIKLGVYQGDELTLAVRLATERQKTDDQYVVDLYAIFQVNNIAVGDVTGCIISSVVPQITSPIKSAVKKMFHVDALVLGAGVKTGLNIKLDDTSTIGSDLVAGCVAAAAAYPCPCIVVGMGTATTISVLDKNKTMIGGALMPGVAIGLNALTSTSALLPSVAFEAPRNVIGSNTDECMRSGIVLGNACMLDGMIEKINESLGAKCTVVATGGLAPTIVNNCRYDIILRDDLLLDGLRIIYNKNKAGKKTKKEPTA